MGAARGGDVLGVRRLFRQGGAGTRTAGYGRDELSVKGAVPKGFLCPPGGRDALGGSQRSWGMRSRGFAVRVGVAAGPYIVRPAGHQGAQAADVRGVRHHGVGQVARSVRLGRSLDRHFRVPKTTSPTSTLHAPPSHDPLTTVSILHLPLTIPMASQSPLPLPLRAVGSPQASRSAAGLEECPRAGPLDAPYSPIPSCRSGSGTLLLTATRGAQPSRPARSAPTKAERNNEPKRNECQAKRLSEAQP